MRFVPKGKTVSLRNRDKQDHAFASDRDPAYNGLSVLVDNDTTGGAVAVAPAANKAPIIGQLRRQRRCHLTHFAQRRVSGGGITMHR